MNVKKWIYGLVVILFFSVSSHAEKNHFFGKEEVIITQAGNNVDNLFSSILNEADFQGFRALCKSNSKVTVELTDANWTNFVGQMKSRYGISLDRNLAKIEFNGNTYLIASGKKYSPQMINSTDFIPKQFVDDVFAGNKVFDPTISTRHLDTEVIGLEFFAKQNNAVKGQSYPLVTGELKITSDLCPCPSCSAVFQQFSTMFPNVNIKIVTSPKLHY
jgi:hypothetical protein